MDAHQHVAGSIEMNWRGIAGLTKYRCKTCGAEYVEDERTPEQLVARGLPPKPLNMAENFRITLHAHDYLAIVRHLAESNPYAWTSRDDERCFFCEMVKPSDRIGKSQLGQPEHLDACLWLRARKMAGMG